MKDKKERGTKSVSQGTVSVFMKFQGIFSQDLLIQLRKQNKEMPAATKEARCELTRLKPCGKI